MAIHASAVAAISAELTAADTREAAAARERRQAEAAAREAAAARQARAALKAIAKKDADVKALQQALDYERAQKEAEMRAQARAAKQEAIEIARRKVAKDKAKTDAEISALGTGKAGLLQEREQEAARAHKDAERCAAEITAAAIEEAERRIQRETPPGGSRVDTLQRLFQGDSASRMKINLDTEDSRSSKGSGRATRPRRTGKGKTSERVQRSHERHSHNSDPFVTCSDGDGRDGQHRQELTGCRVGVPGARGRGGDNAPPSSAGEGPPPPYRSRESSPGRPPPRSRCRWGDMDTDNDMGLDPGAGPSSSGHGLPGGAPQDGGPPGEPPGGGPPGGPPGGGPSGRPTGGGPQGRGPPGRPPGRETPDEPPGADIPERIWRWILYLKRKISSLEYEAQINKMRIGKSAAVNTIAQKELDIAAEEAGQVGRPEEQQ